MKNELILICLVASLLAASPAQREVQFKKIVLDKTFRSEGVAVADVNRDGKTDVLAGNLWYEAPAWTPHEIAEPIAFDGAKGYSNSFVNYAADLNNDAWPDQILIDTPGVPPVLWRENPKGKTGHWRAHRIAPNACNESPAYVRLKNVGSGGKPVLVFSINDEQMVWLEQAKNVESEFIVHAISERIPKDEANKIRGTHRYSHGLGVGDINGDGRDDIVIRSGYWEGPVDAKSTPWKFVQANLGEECSQMQLYDVNSDGLNDVISSSAHRIGVWWYEQSPRGQFTRHTIDDSFSQSHALVLADINGDGLKDIVTGKRFWAHGPTGDINPNDPAVLYWYELKREGKGTMINWLRHRIDSDSGVGTQFVVADLDGDKRMDVITSNKKGVFAFLQLR